METEEKISCPDGVCDAKDSRKGPQTLQRSIVTLSHDQEKVVVF
jgi:hypothetical protein